MRRGLLLLCAVLLAREIAPDQNVTSIVTDKPTYNTSPPYHIHFGPIKLLDEHTISVEDFHLHHQGEDVHFWVGNGEPSPSGHPLLDENSSDKSLSSYDGRNLTLKLPDGFTADSIDYLSVWDVAASQNLGHVALPKMEVTSEDDLHPAGTDDLHTVDSVHSVDPLDTVLKSRRITVQRAVTPMYDKPRQYVQLDPFSTAEVRSGPVVVLDDKTFFVPNLHFNGSDGYFSVGTGQTPAARGTFIYGINATQGALPVYTGQNIYLRLQQGLTVHSFDYLALWGYPTHNFGHVMIPKGLHLEAAPPNPLYTNDGSRIVMIQKCCPIGEVLRQAGCGPGNAAFLPVIDVHVHNETHIDDEPMKNVMFEPFVRPINCRQDKYPLIPGEDAFVLLENSSLLVIATRRMLSQDSYCLESVDFGDDSKSDWITSPLVCFADSEVPTDSFVFIIYAIGLTISAVFLIVTAIIFIVVKEVRDARGKCVIGYSVFMAAGFVCLSLSQFLGIDDDAVCFAIGYLVQFFIVSSFTWLTLIAIETYTKIRNYDNDAYTLDRIRFRIYLGIGLLVPLLTLVICALIEHIPSIPNTILKPSFGRSSCWFDQKKGLIFYFYVPLGVAIIIDIVLAVAMKLQISSTEKDPTKDGIIWLAVRNDLKAMFRSCLFLIIVMTICWVLEVVSFVMKTDATIWIAVDVINSLQGLLVFVIFVLHQPVKGKICRKPRREPEATTDEAIALSPINGSIPTIQRNGNNCDIVRQDFLTNLRHMDSEVSLVGTATPAPGWYDTQADGPTLEGIPAPREDPVAVRPTSVIIEDCGSTLDNAQETSDI